MVSGGAVVSGGVVVSEGVVASEGTVVLPVGSSVDPVPSLGLISIDDVLSGFVVSGEDRLRSQPVKLSSVSTANIMAIALKYLGSIVFSPTYNYIVVSFVYKL